MNRPKAHHYIPQNQLKRFQNDDGQLFLGIKESGKIIPSNAYNAMQESELYSNLLQEPADG